MNGVIALCHFCESHGPAVVLSTQSLRQATQRPAAQLSSSASTGDFHLLASESAWRHPASRLVDMIAHVGLSESGDSGSQSSCRACHFSISREEIGLTSWDNSAKTTYISTHEPMDTMARAAVNRACIRSLSSDVAPGHEGPIYFGDNLNGHIISYLFLLKDVSARGFQMKFSFLFLAWDQIFVMNIWPFVVKSFSSMVSRLQASAEQTFNEEISGSSRSSSPARLSRTPPIRIDSDVISVSLSGLNTKTRIGNSASELEIRTLINLTRDEQVFYRIHSWFTWLLRLAGKQWSIYPVIRGEPDEDRLFQAETSHSDAALKSAGPGPANTSEGLLGHDVSPSQSPGLSLGLTNGTVQQDIDLQMRFLRVLYRSLREEAFLRLIYHLVSGQQVTILPQDDSRLSLLAASSLSHFLPRGCLRMLVDSAEYVGPSYCNLLALRADADITGLDVSAAKTFLLLKISIYPQKSSQKTVFSEVEAFLNSLHFEVTSDVAVSSRSCKPRVTNPESSLLQRLLHLFSIQPQLCPSTLHSALTSMRQEWIDRVRLLFSFKHCQVPSLSAEEAARKWSEMTAALHCGLPADKPILLFWESALSQYSRQNACHPHSDTHPSSHPQFDWLNA